MRTEEVKPEPEKIGLRRKTLLGSVAKWAIRQSPYTIPDDLDKVLLALHESLAEDFPTEYMVFEVSDLMKLLNRKLREIPEYRAWNDRKNGNDAPHKLVSRYGGEEDPDDDFIDLDALERNIISDLD